MSNVVGYLSVSHNSPRSIHLVERLHWAGREPIDVYECGGRVQAGHDRHARLNSWTVADLRDQLRPGGNPKNQRDNTEECRVRDAVASISDPRHLLAYSPLRREVERTGTPDSCHHYEIGRSADRGVWRKARAILAACQQRRADRAIAEAAQLVQTGRIADQVAPRQRARLLAIVHEVAIVLHEARPLYASSRGEINRGAPSDEKHWDVYSKSTKYPCCWSNAGAYLDGHDMVVADSRGREVWRHTVTDADRRARRPDVQAAILLRMVSQAALDRIGPAGEDDRVQLRTPLQVCRSRDGLLVTDHPTQPRIVQVIVRDSTTGQRHHLTVPPRFGASLSDGERPIDRVQAAIAWTFGLAGKKYQPGVEA